MFICTFLQEQNTEILHTIRASAAHLPINRLEKLFILFIFEIKPENKKKSDKTSISQT